MSSISANSDGDVDGDADANADENGDDDDVRERNCSLPAGHPWENFEPGTCLASSKQQVTQVKQKVTACKVLIAIQQLTE